MRIPQEELALLFLRHTLRKRKEEGFVFYYDPYQLKGMEQLPLSKPYLSGLRVGTPAGMHQRKSFPQKKGLSPYLERLSLIWRNGLKKRP